MTARHYDADAEDRYAKGEAFNAVAQVEMLGRSRAFVHAVLREDGKPVSPQQWAELAADLLRAGVRIVEADRGGVKTKTYDLVKLLARLGHAVE